MEVRTARPSDMTELAAVMARAFEDDPIYTWAFPDATSRLRRMTAMNQAMLPRMGSLDFLEPYTTEDLGGLALWAGPEKWDVPNGTMLPAMPKLLRAMGLRPARKFMGAMNALKKHHPKEPHWYLMGIGTDPPKQRTGVGSALINKVLERCDAERIPAYLETQKPENVPYYERFGFRVTGEMDLPLGGPHMWLMWRDR